MATSRGVRWFVRYAVVLAGFVSAVPAGAAGFSEEDALKKGRQTAAAFTDALQEKLNASMKNIGPAETVRVCGYQAQALVREIAANHGVTMRRTSLKLRNAANAPDPKEREILDLFLGQERTGGVMSEMMLKGARQGKPVWYYARPIVMGGNCVACHGAADRIPPETLERLRQLYPDDNATGYAPGDYRGIVSVIIPAE